MKKKVLFLVPYPFNRAPSQRFRVEQFLPLLEEQGVEYELHTFLDEENWKILYQGGSVIRKAEGILKAFRARFQFLKRRAHEFEYIFIHREAAPLGPPVFERWVNKHTDARIIYDFDDAIWIPNITKANRIAGWLKHFQKVGEICRLAHKVVPGNAFLQDYAQQQKARQVVLIPTVVDMEKRYHHTKRHHEEKVVVGWTGSHSTLKYILDLLPILQELQKELDFTVLIIADKKPEVSLTDFQFLPWNPSTEVEDLLRMDIGLMPLEDTIWSKGKCGFKLIQYQAVGIPAIGSDVGVNAQVIEEGVTGFLVQSPEDWKERITTLIKNAALRRAMGEAGKRKMKEEYSLQAMRERFLSLFKD